MLMHRNDVCRYQSFDDNITRVIGGFAAEITHTRIRTYMYTPNTLRYPAFM